MASVAERISLLVAVARELLKGKYGTVRRAVDKKTGVHYAAKFLRRRRRGQCCAKEINHEIAVLMLCASSQHIVRLHAVHETRSETALILELATGGELQTIIDNKGQLSEEKARTCMREVLRALNHLHKQSIIHLDLKPQNILLIGNDVEDGLKLCDFGIARIIGDTGKIMEILGTPDYVAPEVLQYEPLSLRTDIWSIGVLTYVLLTGYSPFGGDNKQETSLNITKCLLDFPEYLFENVSEDAIDFIKCALRIKPKERPTVEECLEHRWLKEKTENTHKVPKDPLTATANTTITVVAKQLPQEEDEPSCPLIIENVPLLRPSNGHHNGHGNNGVSAELPEEAKSKPSSPEEDDESETNKENVLQVQHASTPAPPVSVVEIVTVSLFPDAPTTPKVSRKAPPSEQQQNGQLNHGSHNHHHHHHHHHLSHHHHSSSATSRYHHTTNNNNTTTTTTIVSSRQSSTCSSTPSPHSVKAYVQKFQQQQESTTATAAAVMLPMENGFCAAAAATLCCLKCSEETMGGGPASAAGLAVAVATVASRKTLQCGDKGIIC